MLGLCGFADEISPDLDEQVRVCRACGVSRFELRSVDGINVLDFDRALRERVRRTLRNAGMSVACIGSPIGKVKLSEPWEAHFKRFQVAVEMAEYFDAAMIRIFSYYPAEGDDVARQRDEVMRRMRLKLDYVHGRGIVLVHENESRIFGERGAACLDLMRSIDSPKLRSAFDFANFIVGPGERPRDNWPMLKPYTAHFHIKDARLGDRAIVPAGEGDGEIGAILSDAYRGGYRGLVSLEPHLSDAGQFSGFSGPQLFTRAVAALRSACRAHHVPLEGN